MDKVIRVKFADFAACAWLDNHEKIVTNISDENKGRTVALLAHASAKNVDEKYFMEEVMKKLQDVIEGPLGLVMHQDFRKSKKLTKKASKYLDDSHVAVNVFTLDKGVPTTLEFETFEGCEEILPRSIFTIGESLL